MIFEDYLQASAQRYPDKVAIADANGEITYSQLAEKICSRASALNVEGLLVPLRATSTIDFLVEYFAIHIVGGVAVPLGASMPQQLFDQYTTITQAASVPAGSADVLFTTGTTGRPKGVMISHDAIIANAENLIDAQGYHADMTFVVNGPLNHIGSLSKIYPTLVVGGTVKMVNGMKIASQFFDAICLAQGPVATFLVPASIRMLLALSPKELESCANKLEFIETGAAPITQTDMQQLCCMLPNTRLYNTYASTETGIVATYDYNAGNCTAGCVGRPMRHSRILISPDGHICCQGRTLMSGYLGDEEATNEVLTDATLHTNDLGHIDAEGLLHITGRADDTINVGGYKIAPTDVEAAAMASGCIDDCICIAAPHPLLGTVLKLLVVAKSKEFDRKMLVATLKAKLEPHQLPAMLQEVDHIERTFNGKINRKFYSSL